MNQIGPASYAKSRQPIVSNGQVLISLFDVPPNLVDNTSNEFDGTLAITRGGIQLWHKTGTGPSLSVVGNTAIVPGDVGRHAGIVAVDITNGSECWRFDEGAYPTVAGDIVCIEDGDRLFGLDIRTGSVRWKTENFSDSTSFKYTISAFAANDSLLCGTRRYNYDAPSLVALNPANGSVIWRGDVSRSPWPPVIGPNGVYVLTADETLHAFTRNGTQKWSAETDMVEPPAIGDDSLFATVADRKSKNSIVALDPSNGEERWRVEVGPNVCNTPAVTPESIFVVYGSEAVPVTVAALDPDSGDIQWERHQPGTAGMLPQGPDTSPALTEDGLTFMTGDFHTPREKHGTYIA